MIRRLALLAVLALVGLAGCGEETTTLKPLPFANSGGGGRGDAAAMATATEDAPIYPGASRTVTVKGELPALTGTAAAHSLSKPTAATVKDLATRLGVEGEVVEQHGAYEVRGNGRTLTVQRSGQFSMFPGSPDGVACAKANPDGSVSDEPCDAPVASPPADTATCAPDQPCSVPGSPGSAGGAGASGTSGSEPVAEPPTPTPTPKARETAPISPPEPTKAAAVEAAAAVVRSIGLDTASAEATPAGRESWSFQTQLADNGVTAQGWQMSMTVTTAGVVTNAFGYLGRPNSVGDYPLAGTTQGIERLKGGVTGGDIARPAIACAEPDCGLPPLVITGARLALTLVDTGTEAFLVPAYAFAIEGGGEQVVPAVTDEYIQKVQPMGVDGREPAVDPGRPEPAPAVVEPAEPASAPASYP